MSRRFLERWYGDGGETLDVMFDDVRALYEVCEGSRVVFSSSAFVDVLRWCMRSADEPAPAEESADAIELSPWEPPRE